MAPRAGSNNKANFSRRTEKRGVPGLGARHYAAQWLAVILQRKRSLDDVLTAAEQDKGWQALDPRDKGFARSMLMTALRHHGELAFVLKQFLSKPPQARSGVNEILMIGAAQLLFMDVPPHAAIDLAVSEAKSSDKSRHMAKLVNAVLRRVSKDGAALLTKCDPVMMNIPSFLRERWQAQYGNEASRAMCTAMLTEPPLDLAVKGDAAGWAARLNATQLLSGGVRLARDGAQKGAITELDGFDEGAWWVQDFSAQMPVRLLGDVAGKRVADLCAAPGGKTAGLVAAGARVTAVDVSEARLERVRANLARLQLEAEVVAADVLAYTPEEPFDAVLLDAPCSATGTIRRHPDILVTRSAGGLDGLINVQRAMLKKAVELLKPGGVLIYCTCSLEAEEGEAQINRFLDEQNGVSRRSFAPEDVFGEAGWLTKDGDVRLLPSFSADGTADGIGMDGFFISRLQRAQ